MTVRAFFTAVTTALGSALSAALPDDVRVGFDLSGREGGTWTVENRGGAVTVAAGLGEPLDCLLRGDADVFLAMVAGSEDPRAAFLDGRLDVEGDVGLVLQLRRAVAGRTPAPVAPRTLPA